jgi:hypothetical protein
MTQRTQTYSEFRWNVTTAGVVVYDGKDYLFTIPQHEFPTLILNMVKVLKENTKPIDDFDGGV